jgi:hypothetical protein
MKAMPCDRCRTAKLPDGNDYYLARFPERRGHYVFRCAGCKRSVSMTAIEFNRLPDAGPTTYQGKQKGLGLAQQ